MPTVVKLPAAAVFAPIIPSMFAVIVPALKSPLPSSTTARLAVPSLAKIAVSVRSTLRLCACLHLM